MKLTVPSSINTCQLSNWIGHLLPHSKLIYWMSVSESPAIVTRSASKLMLPSDLSQAIFYFLTIIHNIRLHLYLHNIQLYLSIASLGFDRFFMECAVRGKLEPLSLDPHHSLNFLLLFSPQEIIWIWTSLQAACWVWHTMEILSTCLFYIFTLLLAIT